MLQVPNKHTAKCLEYADRIEALPPEKFSLHSWGGWKEPRCICGWIMQWEGHINKDDWREAASILGMPYHVASRIFSQPLLNKQPGPAEAAQALRHYAVTGEFTGW